MVHTLRTSMVLDLPRDEVFPFFHDRDGGTVVEDRVRYGLPLFPAGEIANPCVRWQLRRIFRYRDKAIHRILIQGG